MTEPISDETLDLIESRLGKDGEGGWGWFITVEDGRAMVAEVRRLRAVVADKDREIAGLVRTCNSWETNYEDARRHAHAVLAEYDKWADL